MTKTPFLSIITACFNSESTLKASIESLLNQSFLKFEYIIIDGKSSDNTFDIITFYEQKFKEKGIQYKFISEKDTGIYNAWNKGLELASGDWISFLGSDDIYTDHALENYANLALLNPNADLIYSKVKIFKKSSFIREINKQWNWNKFKKNMNIAHVGAFHNKNYFKKFGTYNESYKIVGDYEMLLRAGSSLKTVFLDEFTVIMQDGGVSSTMFLKAIKEVEKAKINSAGVSYINTKVYSLNFLFRYFGGKLLRKLKSR